MDHTGVEVKELEIALALREALAEQEHTQWAHWTKYMLDTVQQELEACESPKEMYEVLKQGSGARWRRQIDTPYAELSEKEKDSDREWAVKVLQIVVPYMTHKVMQAKNETYNAVEEVILSKTPTFVVDADLIGLRQAVLDLLAQFEDPDRNDQNGDIQPQLDRLAHLVGYDGPIIRRK